MLQYLRNVTTLKLDEAACVGCGLCTTVCPHNVFVLAHGKAAIQDRDGCIECGACARNCPVGALFVDADVGCATGMIYRALGVESDCCCSTKRTDQPCC